jgi:hypothetical protein
VEKEVELEEEEAEYIRQINAKEIDEDRQEQVLLEGEELRSHQGDYYQQEVKGGVSA